MAFETRFCDKCESGGGECLIFASALICEISDSEYPVEFIMTEGDYSSARCTAFKKKGLKPPLCENCERPMSPLSVETCPECGCQQFVYVCARCLTIAIIHPEESEEDDGNTT